MLELVAEHGFADVRVTDLIARAGVAKPRFYELYESKVGCFLALIDAIFADLIREIAQALDPTADVEARVAQGMTSLVAYTDRKPEETRILFVEGPVAGREAIDRISAGHDLLAEFYIALREEVRKLDPSRPPLSHTRAVAIVGAISGAVSARLRQKDPINAEQMADELTAVVSLLAVG